ncbi:MULTISPECIES: ParB/RepB/Spo0J family partition protein [Thermaerobacter]|uniref:ParB/RepB/Spo0J family partition protein n=1 Tax=Thermaerobacter composti TaxID=554949 RepID=A0ABZ0QNP6_9FIRM|nr:MULTISPECIES: ParB/RepB/Spo0J family partition protein [Thermaerobacter]PZN06611.1 MAG: chromosome partitioning protein ParB [Bacillota bacterium]QBS37090.1 ParB/RepB/Spo0J family partition protein [Thermaerobacter sp. FW80]WPD19106.1 ParB/RepB/Spo0J family partition protein [Thermaerobacter composti]
MSRSKRGLARGIDVKGLEALLPGVRPDPAAGEQVEQIPVERIRPNPYQPRRQFDPDALAELVESVRQHGIVQPLLVRPEGDGYRLVAGERRWRAAQAAGLATVPAVVREFSDVEMMEIALVENLQREDLNPIEEAQGYRTLSEELGLTQEQISQRVGKSRSHIANLMRLLSLPDDLRRLVAEGKLSTGHAKVLLGVGSAAEMRRLAAQVLAEGLTVRQLEDRIAQRPARPRRSRRVTGPPAPEVEDLVNRLQRALNTRVAIRGRGARGQIVIEYYSWDDLERILARLEASAAPL